MIEDNPSTGCEAAMDDPKDEHSTDRLIDTICAGCDLPFPVNELGLCAQIVS
jgi:hypothetical protein